MIPFCVSAAKLAKISAKINCNLQEDKFRAEGYADNAREREKSCCEVKSRCIVALIYNAVI